MKLEEFDPSQQDLTSTVAVFGKRHSGKSVFVVWLLWKLHQGGGKNGQRIDAVVVFSDTEAMQSQFSRCVPTAFIHGAYNEMKIVAILEAQKALLMRQGRTSNIVVLLDDCGFDKKIFTKALRQVFSNGRHFKILFVIALQYIYQLPSELRGNVDVCISFREPNGNNRKKLFEMYGIMGNVRMFEKYFKEVTTNYGALICVNNGSSSNEITKNVFWARANPEEIPRQFRLGRPIFWEWSRQFANRRQVVRPAGQGAMGSVVLVRKQETPGQNHHHYQRSEVRSEVLPGARSELLSGARSEVRSEPVSGAHSRQSTAIVRRVAPPLSLIL